MDNKKEDKSIFSTVLFGIWILWFLFVFYNHLMVFSDKFDVISAKLSAIF